MTDLGFTCEFPSKHPEVNHLLDSGCPENNSTRHGTKVSSAGCSSVALWNSLKCRPGDESISGSSSLQERTAPSSQEVLVRRLRGWEAALLHSWHSQEILETWPLIRGPHAAIPQDGKGKTAPWYYSSWHVLNPLPIVQWGSQVFTCNSKDQEGDALLLTDRLTGCSWSQTPQKARPGYEEWKAPFPKNQAPRGQIGPQQTSRANYGAT